LVRISTHLGTIVSKWQKKSKKYNKLKNKDYVYDSHRQPSWNLGYQKELLFAVIFITNSVLGNCWNPDVQAPKEIMFKLVKFIKWGYLKVG
jgi:hypothetical protein